MVQVLLQYCTHAMDLGFSSLEDEATFKRLLMARASTPGLLLFIVFFLITAAQGTVFYASEAGRDDQPFRWEASDPRSATFGIDLFVCIFVLLFITTTHLRMRLELLRSRDWEVPWIGAAVLIIVLNTVGNRWHIAAFYRRCPADVWLGDVDAVEHTTLQRSEAFTLGACLFLPVRCCMLWVLPACAVCSFVVVSLSAGTPYPAGQALNLCALFIICASAFFAALLLERSARVKLAASSQSQDSSCSPQSKQTSGSSRVLFFAQHDEDRDHGLDNDSLMLVQEQELVVGSEEKRLEVHGKDTMSSEMDWRMQALMDARCDAILKLSIDLRICDSGAAEEAFFGRHVEGRLFTLMIGQGHKTRFVRLLNKTYLSRCIHSLSVPLIFACGPVKHRLSVVDTGRAEPRYLIGVSTREVTTQLPGSSLLLPIMRIPSASSGIGAQPMMAVPSVTSTVRTVPSCTSNRSCSSSSDRHSDRPSGPAMPSEASASASAAFSWSISSGEYSQVDLIPGKEQAVQAEPTCQEAGTDTNPVRRLQAVPCRCVNRGAMRPRPLPPAGAQNGQQAMQLLAPVSGGAFDGRWLLVPGSGADVREWLQTFVIRGDVGIDGVGRPFNLEKKDGQVVMKGGCLSFDGRLLSRDGKSGVRLQFVRVDGPEGPEDDDDEDDRLSFAPTPSAPPVTPTPSTPPPPAVVPSLRRFWRPWN